MFTIKSHLILSAEDTEFIVSLSKNEPTNKGTAKQRERIGKIYYDHVGHHIVKGWAKEIWLLEREDKWADGSRPTEFQCKRMILKWVTELKPTLTNSEGAELFFGALGRREAYMILLEKGYEYVEEPKHTYIAKIRVRKPDRSANTYHDVTLLDSNGKLIDERIKVYGYGSQYEVTTQKMLESPELSARFPEIKHENSFNSRGSSVRQALDKKYINIIYLVSNY
ncbi:MAG: hypothetical protein EOO39_00130 [Cytophagaceae bacterium]|nr:MAG: hypothetical protein EOO39_00130 [Cytophagaceae bacterium]